MPAISVILPVYNRAGVVGRAIESVLEQDFPDFELVVVDDGSTDGSVDVCANYSDPRVQLVRLPRNEGGNAARNRGIASSSAPIITFLDSDDHYLPNKLRHEVETFAKRPDLDVLLTGFRFGDEAAGKRAGKARSNPLITEGAEFAEALYLRRLRKGTPGIAARRSALERIGGFDEALRRRQDFDLLVRLAKVAQCETSEAITWVKTEADDAISADKTRFIPALIAFYERHPEYYDNPSYRRGFAIDVGRHLAWHVTRGRFGQIAGDLRLLFSALGPLRLARLLAEAGFRYPAFRRRRRKERRRC